MRHVISNLFPLSAIVFALSPWVTLLGQQSVVLPSSADELQFKADIELNAENYAAWRTYILPDKSELIWQQIPWLTTFRDGILQADRAGKPLLLWTMNGHPLACT